MRHRIVVCCAPNHYLNQCWFIVSWTIGNTLLSHLNEATRIFIMFIQENEFGLDLYDNYIKWVSRLPTTHLHTLNIIRDLIKCNHLLITFLNHSYEWIVTVTILNFKNKILNDNGWDAICSRERSSTPVRYIGRALYRWAAGTFNPPVQPTVFILLRRWLKQMIYKTVPAKNPVKQ